MKINVNSLVKKYGKFTALKGVTMSISGGCVGLLGPNGAGKSTLIKALMSLVSYQEGTIEVLGMDACRDARRIRQRIGYMPEDECFIPGIPGVSAISFVGELSGLPRLESLGRAHEICDFVGLDEERYRETDTFSAGMRQKMKFAQAIVHDPEVVFLDEPTNGLDPESRNRMLNLITHLARDREKTIILSTHLLADVESICDSAVILGHGKVLKQGPLSELTRISDPGLSIRISENSEQFEKALKQNGCVFDETEPLEYVVSGDNAEAAVIEAARETGSSIKKIMRSKNSLEKVFLEALEDGGN